MRAEVSSATDHSKREATGYLLQVCLTVDVEPDCPPYLNTWRGIEEGAPVLFDVLEETGVPATFFTTGEVARRYPDFVGETVDRGHELGSHGMSHTSFATMDVETARNEIEEASAVLRQWDDVRSFRAPYLQFRDRFLDILRDDGYLVDSSLAKYKLSYLRSRDTCSGISRIAASATSSVLRLPRALREFYLGRLASPVVLFVHPWEFVDLTREDLRLDCRFKTGPKAAECLRSVIDFFKGRDAEFHRVIDLLDAGAPDSTGNRTTLRDGG